MGSHEQSNRWLPNDSPYPPFFAIAPAESTPQFERYPNWRTKADLPCACEFQNPWSILNFPKQAYKNPNPSPNHRLYKPLPTTN